MADPSTRQRERGSGHLFLRGRTWWIQYNRRGRVFRETTRSTKRTVAERKLRRRLGEIHVGEFVGPRAERVRYEELAADLLNYYVTNGKKSLVRPKSGEPYVADEPHLQKFFAGYRALYPRTSTDRQLRVHRDWIACARGTAGYTPQVASRFWRFGPTPMRHLRFTCWI